jgi:maltooligosyltrehalose trehalohydrolase
MLFQGQEFAASAPFLYFADHNAELARLVRKGRVEFLQQFPSIATADVSAALADPGDRATFERCKLNFAERERHAEAYALHRDLLRLRREDPVFRACLSVSGGGPPEGDPPGRRPPGPGGVDGAVLGPEAFVLRYFGGEEGDRLLLVNFGRDLRLQPAPEPLLAPPRGRLWQVVWSSEDLRYGGSGTPPVETEEGWRLPGHMAVVLAPRPPGEGPDATASLVRPTTAGGEPCSE